MIGMVKTGSSFYHLISYVLEDKRELSEEQKVKMSLKDGVRHKNRAEILAYNNCFGDKYEMAEQFRDVARLSKRVEKPAFHFSLRLAEGDHLPRAKLIELGEALVKEFAVADHQYLIVLHKDTREQHFHIIANRVGLNGKAVTDSNSYKRIAAFCRKQEQKLGLTQVLSPKAFLPKEQQSLPRQDRRKTRLRDHISQTLRKVNNYPDFEKAMCSLGYTIIRGRGISFIDGKKVKTKGSEVGFPLSKIEKILSLKMELKEKQSEKRSLEVFKRSRTSDDFGDRPDHTSSLVPAIQQLSNIIEQLLKPEIADGQLPYELTQVAYARKQKSKKKGRSL